MESTYQKPANILNIELSKIIISHNNVRKNLEAGNEDSSIEDLAKSIDKNGLINPITVKQINGDFELIIGQRRFIACQLLGWETIPALITCVDDVQAQILSLIENVHRADLHPLDKGTAYQQLYNNFGTYTTVSRETGVSVSTVKRYMMLLKLSPNIQNLLTTGDGPAGICTLSLLAELFSDFDNQEYVLDQIGRFKQQVQLEILKLSEGDITKIDALVVQALGGCFSISICKGLITCPHIPDECRDDVMKLITKYTSALIPF